VTQVQRTDGTGTTTWGYTYDDAGNMKTRPGPTGQQTLDWDPEGKLVRVTEAGQTTTYIYDGQGNRLLAKDPQGTTLYLGTVELRSTSSGVTGTRYYSFGGETVAQRTASGVRWLCGDAQGTGQVAVTADATQTVTKRRQKPFGEERGPTSWVNDKGFLNGTKDPTGLTHLCAREYDPALGAFISADPVLDVDDPQQMNGYNYSYQNPVTFSDATGMRPFCEEGFWCGVMWGVLNYFNPLKYFFMVKDFIKMMEDPKGAWKKFEADAKRWGDKIGNEAAGWACAISGLCEVFEDCTNASFECGEFIGEMLMELIETVVMGIATGGASLTASIGKLVTKMITKAAQKGLKLPSLDSKKPHGHRDGDGNGNGDGPSDGGRDGSKDENYNDNDDIKDHRRDNDGGSCATPNSFDPDTPVVLADGTTKPIKDVALGDKVLASDPETGVTEAKLVTYLHVNNDRTMVDLTVSDGAGKTGILLTTAEHPFWSVTDDAWVNAEDLRPGDRLLSVDGRTAVTVTSVRVWTGLEAMYNLTVDGIHTYYVMAGSTSVLVHNTGGDPCDPDGTNGYDPSDPDDDLGSTARSERDEFGHQNGREYTTYTAAYNPLTGRIVVGGSSHFGCAEFVCEVWHGGGPSLPMFTKAFGFRGPGGGEWVEIPVCVRCQARYSREQFPPDVSFDPGGRWSQ
jgi:RHS repeat-associated protein